MSPAMNNKSSEEAMAESFVLSNAAPQVGKGFNRDYWARFERFVNDTVVSSCRDVYVVTGPLYLDREDELALISSRLPSRSNGAAQATTAEPQANSLIPFEERRWTDNDAQITGSTNEMPAPSTPATHRRMRVPTHFYKVILGELKETEQIKDKNGANIVVGAFVLPNAQIHPSTPLSSFQISLKRLETIAGVDFFPSLSVSSSSSKKALENLCSLNGCTLPPEQFWLAASTDGTARTTRSTGGGSGLLNGNSSHSAQ